MTHYAIRDEWLQAGTYRTHYIVAGAGRPVVGIHGVAAPGADWQPMMTALAPSCRFLAPDMPGYGQTVSPLTEYRPDDYVSFIRDFVNATGAAPVTLIGHSIGARFALEAALRDPHLVSSLILIDTMGFGKLTPLGRVILGMFEGIRRLLRRPQPHPVLKLDGDPDLLCLGRLASLTRPVLLIWGKRDLYYPPAQARRACRLLPDCRLEVIPGARHAPHKEKPEAVYGIIRSFLAARVPA